MQGVLINSFYGNLIASNTHHIISSHITHLNINSFTNIKSIIRGDHYVTMESIPNSLDHIYHVPEEPFPNFIFDVILRSIIVTSGDI